jgi:hypothetical protein
MQSRLPAVIPGSAGEQGKYRSRSWASARNLAVEASASDSCCKPDRSSSANLEMLCFAFIPRPTPWHGADPKTGLSARPLCLTKLHATASSFGGLHFASAGTSIALQYYRFCHIVLKLRPVTGHHTIVRLTRFRANLRRPRSTV